ncbi:hypothetical protein BC938DRAFT_471289 [Jimgerdemannia flammicorona]|uniref:Pre-mRNA-splicing factor 18 n=1 Tax=Jimgerdemannia flammicorona TaxID=994334 RepID=A0A433Q8H3_9FUNG|nr:hypothetical protein BC938DRAFT_471289 [Jimgerdemannia flammicorona]
MYSCTKLFPTSTFLTISSQDDNPELFNISPDEIIRRLRAKGHPIRLFGETDKQRKIRLRALELMEERTDSSGQRNDFMRTLEDLESGLDLEALKKKAGVDDDKKVRKSRIGQESLLATPIELDFLQSDPDKLYPLIYAFLKRILREWEESLDERPDEVKRSVQGKRIAATMKQTADYLKPLFRQLKSRDLEPDILARITEITHNMQQRLYLKAQDAYLRLSIGNSPWPIGVTMVGIHERSAREKIFAAQVAHVLNDETTRKWIQSLKRLMSFCQDKYPPDTLAQRIG